MKVIFLDIDGVLNCKTTTAHCEKYIGIDSAKVKLLRKLVEKTGAIIVLTSSWKVHWNQRDRFDKYMHNKFGKGHIEIYSCTDDTGYKRGTGIKKWLDEHDNVESWVVLDDEVFGDYNEDILKRLIKTSWDDPDGGLHEKDIEEATLILNNNSIIANWETINKPDDFIHVGL